MVLYVGVEEVVAAPAEYQGHELQVHGTLVEGSIIEKVSDTGDYRFVIENAGERLDVHFTNVPPDTFRPGVELVLTGRLDASGHLFESDDMRTRIDLPTDLPRQ